MAPVPDPDDWLGKPEPLHLDGIISSADADGLHALISERDLFGGPLRGDGLAWAAAATEADGTTWTNLLAIDTAADRRDITDRLPRAELSLGRDAVAVYDRRAGEILPPDDAIGASLGPRECALFVCCPVGPDGPEVGDPTEYVTVAAR